MAPGRGSGHRVVRVARAMLWGLAVVHVWEAMALRRRREKVLPLPGGAGGAGTGKVDVLAVGGTRLDEATRAAVHQEMDLRGIGVIDLVPGDLPADRWLRLLRRVDPATVGTDPLKHPGGANEVLVLHPSVAERMGVDGDQTPDRG